MRSVAIIILMCLFVSGCDEMLLGSEHLVGTEQYLQTPPALDDDIEVSSPSAQGIDPAELYELIERFQKNGSNGMRSILIAKNNKLVLEAYFNGWHRKRRQDMRSASKSFVSAIMGIAVDKGFIGSIDEKVLDHFPEYENPENWDERKAQMTIKDFLRMRTGLSCNDWATSSPGNQERMYPTDDWIKFIFDLPMSREPGESFSYCSGAPIVLSAIVKKSSGTTQSQFADKNLFEPLGIRDYVWEYMPPRREYAGGKVHLRPRDFLKFGLLFLNDGVWQGREIISPAWIAESTMPTGHVPGDRPGVQYGYYWWFTSWNINDQTINAYYAHGNGGQVMYIIKELNLVVAFTGGAYNTNAESRLYNLMGRTILPAIVQ